MIKELPAELWAQVAGYLKRQPPTPGEKANWNDDFHQQDLVNLQRCSKVCLPCRSALKVSSSQQTLYQVVSPILYDSPIVQNLGLLLLGIETPRSDDDQHSIPYHKTTLLDQVRALHIIHASSRIPNSVIHCYMASSYSPPWESLKSDVEDADTLGRADLDSWMLAAHLIDRYHKLQSPQCLLFKDLRALMAGTWDDHRWQHYLRTWVDEEIRPDFYDSDNPYIVEAGLEIEDMPRSVGEIEEVKVESRTPTALFIGTLWKIFRTGVGERGLIDCCWKPNTAIDLSDIGTGLNTIHGLDEHGGPYGTQTRVYIPTSTTMWRDFVPIDFGPLILYADRDGSLVFKRRTLDDLLEPHYNAGTTAVDAKELDVCIVPAYGGHAAPMAEAGEVKQALETFCGKRENKAYVEKYLSNYNMLVGDKVPACPCCGSRR